MADQDSLKNAGIALENLLTFMSGWPKPLTLPETNAQKEFLSHSNLLWIGKTKWLEHWLISRTELAVEVNLKWQQYKPYAVYSVALLEFCYQAYPKLSDQPFWKEHIAY